MQIIRNMLNQTLPINKKGYVTLLPPKAAVEISEEELKFTQIKNLLRIGSIKVMNIEKKAKAIPEKTKKQ